jgi:hypothetical protein
VIGLAGYKTISIVLLVVLVALAAVSPVFALPPITLNPPAACPGATVTVTRLVPDDIVGGGISIAAVSPLNDGTETIVLSSDPGGLIAEQECGVVTFTADSDTVGPVQCTFLVSESACGHYTVTLALEYGENSEPIGYGQFDVPSTCCAVVGGCVQPVNTFALLSPWLAAIGLIGCIGTVVVVAKKRQS